jgi:hypothetical protein
MSTASKNSGFRYAIARVVRTSLALAFPLIGSLTACGGTSDMPMCSDSTKPQAAAQFCAPSNIAAGQALKLQIREQCGGCTSRATKCEVVVTGMEIKLQLMGEVCVLPAQTACPAICSITTFDCAVPALAAGTYKVSTPAGSTTVSMMTADTTTSATSCTVPAF